MLESPKTSSLMVRSDEGISGATSLKDKYSLFTFKHKAPQDLNNFEPTFVAEKHVLAAGDKLFLAGNRISNSDSVHRTETTLFQLAIGSNPAGIWINGVPHSEADFSATLGSGGWLIDDNGVGYYLIEAEQVKVSRGLQTSRHNKTKAETSGAFSSAWIDHGVAPDEARYRYVMVMDTTPAEMAAFASQMQNAPLFTLSENSENGAVLLDSSNNLYGYSTFAAASFTQGPVTSVSQTALVLAQQDRKELYLSVASPELNIQENDQPTPPVTIEVEVKGEWDIANATYTHQSGNTHITVQSQFGQPVNLTLTQDGGNHDENVDNGNDGNSGNNGDNSSDSESNNGENGDSSGNNGSSSNDSNGGSGGSTSLATIACLMALLHFRRRC